MDRVHSLPPHLLERYRAWRSGSYPKNQEYFRRLAAEGQSPSTMIVACCDSRVTVELLFGPNPGEIFVQRNIANFIPHYSPDGGHHGTGAAVEFAVTVLKVRHLVIMGHSLCGGVKGCLSMCKGEAPELESSTSLVGRWLDEMRPAYEGVAHVADPEAQQRAMEHEAVKLSLENLMGYPFVRAAVDAGELTLHGLWIEIGEGIVQCLEGSTGEFVEL